MTQANMIAETPEQIRRVEESIRETYSLLAKELAFRPEFRIQATIDRYTAHLDKLQAMLPAIQ